MHVYTLSVVFPIQLYNKLEGTLTGVIRVEGAEENIWALLRRLTGGWKNLQNEDFHDFYR